MTLHDTLLTRAQAALTACGGSESATDVVARAFGKGDPIKSATVDVSLDLSGEAAGGQPLKLGLKGPYKTEGKGASFDFAVDLGSALAAADFHFVADDVRLLAPQAAQVLDNANTPEDLARLRGEVRHG